MSKISIILCIVGAILYFGGSVAENIIKKKNKKDEE